MVTDITSSPDSSRRPALSRGAAWFIGLFLLVQLLLPLRYYLSAPTPDERFAWRMFSYEGMHRYTLKAWAVVERGGKRMTEPVDVHNLPISFKVENNRPGVVRRFMEWLCERPGVVEVRLQLQATTPHGERLEPVHYWMSREEGVMHEGERGG